MMLFKLLSRMERFRFESAVISLAPISPGANRIVDLGIPVRSMGLKPRRPDPAALFRMAEAVRTFKPDLIQAWMYHGNIAALIAASLLPYPVPVLWGIRSSLHGFWGQKRMTRHVIRAGAWLSRRPARILYNGRVSASQHEAIGYHPAATCVIPNGFDCELFKPNPQARGRLRADLNVPPETELVGLVARFHPTKDHRTFLAAAANLVQDGSEAHFVLAGRGVTIENSDLTTLIQSHSGLERRIHLLGERLDTPFLNSALDLATTSSSAESFPNVVCEAMASGVPCVVTDVGDSAWIVGDASLVVPPADPKALATAWRRVIEMTDEDRQALGARARQRVLTHFSLDSAVRQYQDLYAAVAERFTLKQSGGRVGTSA